MAWQIRLSVVCLKTATDCTYVYFILSSVFYVIVAVCQLLIKYFLILILSVVCDVRAPYLGGLTFREYFGTILQAGYLATHPRKITKIVQGDHPQRWR